MCPGDERGLSWATSGQGAGLSSVAPRPPLTWIRSSPASAADLAASTADGRFGYLRHLLGDPDLPAAELLAVHYVTHWPAHADEGPFGPGMPSGNHHACQDDYPR